MRPRSIGLVLITAAGLGCGSENITTPPPPPTPAATTTPAAPVRAIHVTSSVGPLARGAGIRLDVDNIPAGKVDAVLDWKAETGNLNVYVTQASCAGIPEVLSGQCTRLTDASGNAKPETLTFDNPTTRTWTFWIYNAGPASESGTLEVAVTKP